MTRTTENPQSDFFHLLQSIMDGRTVDAELTCIDGKKLSFKPEPMLTFPVRDVSRWEENVEEVSVFCHFMGLYGVDSPLPPYFNHECLGNEETKWALRSFLDVINHRYYALHFLAWQTFSLVSRGKDYFHVLKGMSGGVIDSSTSPLSVTLGKDHLSGILAIWRYHFPSIQIKSCQDSEGWVDITTPLSLGGEEAVELGSTTLLGNGMMEGHAVIHLESEPVPYAEVTLWQDMKQSQVKTFLSSIYGLEEGLVSLRVTLNIIPNKGQLTLGNDHICLGWHAWVGALCKIPYPVSIKKSC